MAMDYGLGYGNKGKLPWPRNKEDLKIFKDLTINNHVIMGFNTYQSMLKANVFPLVSRVNHVFTRNPEKVKTNNCFVWKNKQMFMHFYEKHKSGEKDFIVIGGYGIFNMFRNELEEMHISFIEGEFECDKRFPAEFVDYCNAYFTKLSNTSHNGFDLSHFRRNRISSS